LGGFPSNYPIEVLFLGHLIEREVLKRREDRLWVTGGRLRGKERSLLHPLKISKWEGGEGEKSEVFAR
jgi:hypothetical protein